MPEDTLPPIPNDLSETETGPSIIEASFEKQRRALQKTAKNLRKTEQRKRQRERDRLQHEEEEQQQTVVVAPPTGLMHHHQPTMQVSGQNLNSRRVNHYNTRSST